MPNLKKLFVLCFSLMLLALLGLQMSATAEELPSAPSTFYLDQPNLLSNETKELVQQKNRLYKEKEQAPQVLLAVVQSTDGDSIDSYAADLFKKWALGNKNEQNGVLILYALNDGKRNVRIEVGYGLEDVITDSLAGNILQHAKEELKSTDAASVNKGLQYTFNAVTTLIDEHYDYPKNEQALSSNDLKEITTSSSSKSEDFFEIILIGVIVLAVIFSGFGRGGRGGPRGRGGGPWYWGGGSSSGGSGGFGGGSFGGGGGFSGGGGSSGGGGASI